MGGLSVRVWFTTCAFDTDAAFRVISWTIMRAKNPRYHAAADPEDAGLDDWLPLEAVQDMAASVADGMCTTMGVVCRESSTSAASTVS
jgi:hypothetical protein